MFIYFQKVGGPVFPPQPSPYVGPVFAPPKSFNLDLLHVFRWSNCKLTRAVYKHTASKAFMLTIFFSNDLLACC